MNNRPGDTASLPNGPDSNAGPFGRVPLSQQIRLQADNARQALIKLPILIYKNWAWVLVGAIYLLAWWIPFLWSKDIWNHPHHVEMFQPWLLPSALFLLYVRRNTLRETWLRAQRTSRSRRPTIWQRGNASILVIGCVLLMLVHLIQVKGLSVIAMILIAVGIVYQMFGLRVLRAASAPLLLLCLMIPLPDSLLDHFDRQARGLTFQLLAKVLSVLHHPVSIENGGIRFLNNDFTVNYNTAPVGNNILATTIGTEVAVGAALVLLVYGMYKRYGSVRIIGAMLTAVITALTLNFVRMLAVALLAERSPSVSDRLKDYNTWLMVLLVSVIAGLLVRGINAIWMRWFAAKSGARGGTSRNTPFGYFLQRLGQIVSLPFVPLFLLLGLAGRAGGGVGNIARRNEIRTERVLHSVSPAMRALLIPLTLLRRSERGIEQFFRRITKKKRGRHSGRRR